MNTKQSRRETVLALGFAALSLVACSGSTDGAVSTTAAASPVSSNQPSQPESKLDTYFRSRVGRSVTELDTLYQESIWTSSVACIQDGGWTAKDIEPLAETDRQREQPEGAGLAPGASTAWAIESLRTFKQATVSGPGEASSIELERAWLECKAAAERDTPNPIEPLYEQLNKTIEDHNSQVKADPRVAAAGADLEACLGQLGYTEASYDAAKDEFTTKANQILDSVGADEMSADDGIVKLEALNDDEVNTLGGAADCYATYKGVLGEVSDEVDVATIEAHAATFDEIFSQINASLKQLDPA